MSQFSDSDIRERFSLATNLLTDGGEMFIAGFKGRREFELKPDGSQLTKTDTRINRHFDETIEQRHPMDNTCGEEGGRDVGGIGTWVFDPIDGTRPFISGLGTCAISIAFCDGDGIPLFGAILNPLTGDTYTAIHGQGALRNGTPVRVSDQQAFEGSLIHNETGRAGIKLDFELAERGARSTRTYGVIAASALIASGGYDAALFSGTHPWDIAALKVIIEEAGGRVTDRHGNDQRYDREGINGAIMSNGHLHPLLLELDVPTFL